MDEAMSEERLAGLEESARTLARGGLHYQEDVLVLVAEVRRLREEVATLNRVLGERGKVPVQELTEALAALKLNAGLERSRLRAQVAELEGQVEELTPRETYEQMIERSVWACPKCGGPRSTSEARLGVNCSNCR